MLLDEPQLSPSFALSGSDAPASGCGDRSSRAATFPSESFEYADGFSELVNSRLGFLELLPKTDHDIRLFWHDA